MQGGDSAEDHHDELAFLGNPPLEPFPMPLQELLLPASAAGASGLGPEVVEKRPVEQPAGGGTWVLPVSTRVLTEVRGRINVASTGLTSLATWQDVMNTNVGKLHVKHVHVQVQACRQGARECVIHHCETANTKYGHSLLSQLSGLHCLKQAANETA